jgi:hypothetical protein
MTMRRTLIAVLTATFISGCVATTNYASAPSATHPIGRAITYLVVTPAAVLTALVQGISALPYFVAADLHRMNAAMVQANARVTLGRTYQYAYNARIDTVSRSGDTGRVFQHVSGATRYFQRVLRGYGVPNHDRYIITAVRSADRDGYTLYALVYRPTRQIRVRDRSGRVVVLTPSDVRRYYHPFDRDADGAVLDTVIDWAGVPRTMVATQKSQAILLTLAANSVIVNRRSEEFWSVRRRWIAGGYRAIANERRREIQRRIAN